MQSIESLTKSLGKTQVELEATMPGSFVKYDPVKKKSSKIALASDSGVILKYKPRRPEKALYEFLSLEVWNQLLEEYSKVNDIFFRAPKPLSLFDSDEGISILMSFLNGYEVQKLGVMKRTTPVQIKNQKYPIPLYPACALHLGALNRLKEQEGLYHSDYGKRHIIFSPVKDVSIGVVDVENSRRDILELVKQESLQIKNDFQEVTSSSKDLEVLNTWYSQGENDLVIPEKNGVLDKVLERVRKKYDIDFDFTNVSINGYHLNSNASI
jgi:hypothetical protein